ncbi:glycosyltransferase family 4 protein [Synechococcus elongatus]|uniref:Glycosyltransferase n=2 Tax=Synechococcus elongatus TaxID=32046 RepID=Q31LY7_SYNE7|nr:glycosyltransferase family 4 protein [Synechococcus elongatus]ABB57932.1 putative glycosyltransferase [Synechococcus elongatus PCC 7942 = FACHB-805]AJD57588.1 glycosyl transferase [Synechococcus elongatus UTEX 2973]MBD2586649.1 glycosyltransferase family 4 protein [Synechococcus elongatus FACHB-242]MBD2687723.1 glycosyltransferase family 4 protein [Synechococcus elongatus FACHB-1061]MBD2706567.1 glycosyltransferase family 4 protein [Synechococcus elongatus PCC 7942 = FACHB-805]
MRIAIATVQVPFCRGGAELHAERLQAALQNYGYQSNILTIPFAFSPPQVVSESIDIWQSRAIQQLVAASCDALVTLRFPAYLIKHPKRVLWLLHQHRAVYDLWETPYTDELSKSSEGKALQHKIQAIDTREISQYQHRFSNSITVSERLYQFNGITSEFLYHPPPLVGRYYCQPAQPFIFCPSRLEDLKRQDLLIEAIAKLPDVCVILAGEGGNRHRLEALISDLGLQDRVRLLGHISEAELLAFYANCRAVFYAPYDEDFGYVTLEAMLSRKPVITCLDSGEPARIIQHQQTGWICEPTPDAIAEVIQWCWQHSHQLEDIGIAGWDHYQSLGISWENVVNRLTSSFA